MPKDEVGTLAEKPTEVKKDKVYYPTLSFTEKDVPGISKYDIGSKVRLMIVGKISRMSQESGEPKRITVECQRAAVKRKY